jgi:hypothetical protein
LNSLFFNDSDGKGLRSDESDWVGRMERDGSLQRQRDGRLQRQSMACRT